MTTRYIRDCAHGLYPAHTCFRSLCKALCACDSCWLTWVSPASVDPIAEIVRTLDNLRTDIDGLQQEVRGLWREITG